MQKAAKIRTIGVIDFWRGLTRGSILPLPKSDQRYTKRNIRMQHLPCCLSLDLDFGFARDMNIKVLGDGCVAPRDRDIDNNPNYDH